jgi:heterodisulfide reductase subunit B
VFNKFGIELQTVPDFNCCGYPARNVDEKAYLLPSVRNMAIAEKMGLDIIVICNCCFASLQKAKNVMAKDGQLKDELNGYLTKEGLQYKGNVQIRHYLTVLYEDVGTDKIKSRLVNRFKDLNISVIHGCHVLRPREITNFDNSFVPKITEELLQVTGATSLDWRGKLECCGAALAGINNDLSQKLLKEKIVGAQTAGADYITPVCSYCHLQFDTAQINMRGENSSEKLLPVLLFPQLLGLCLGIDEKTLGIEQNSTINAQDIERIKSLLGPPVEEKKKKRKSGVTV